MRHPASRGSRLRHRARSALAILTLVGCTLPALAAISASERQVLIDLYNSTAGDGWTHNNGWKTGGNFSVPGTECTWYGVACDTGGNRVTGLNLNDNNPVGPLPASLNTLTALEHLWANSGDLRGPLPSLGGLSALREVSIQYQPDLTGPMPALAGLAALEDFYLNNTRVSGPIPPLTALPALRVLSLGHNQLSGAIPSLADLPALEVFHAADNQLSGTPPAGAPARPAARAAGGAGSPSRPF